MSAKSALLRKLIASCLVLSSAIAYENAYDLFERRNRKLHEPDRFRSAALSHDRSDIFSPHYGYFNRYFREFGNGYDNLGNGIRSAPFSWRFQQRPLRRRAFSDFGFHDRHLDHRSHRYRPAFRYYPHADGFGTRGNADLAEMDRFLEETEDKHQKKSEEVHERSDEGASMDSLRREKSGEELREDQLGENKSTARSNKMVKKGRTTKGFAVHHHKDETGNSTTFFDETSDYGDQSDLREFGGIWSLKEKDVSDGFGSKRILEQVVRKGDDKHFKENGGQTKSYSSGLLLGNQRFEKDLEKAGNRRESERNFRTGSEGDDFVPPKTYQYLNGDPFDFAEEEAVHEYY